MSWSVIKGDMRGVLPLLQPESVDSIVCDPPYGLSKEPDVVEVLTHWLAGDDYVHKTGGFMGKSWDSFVPGPSYWRACYDALKPGGYLIAFGGTRTYDLMVVAVRLAGFEVRDQLQWLYGQGFPKSLDVSKAIDRQLGQPQAVAGRGDAVDRGVLDYGGATGKAKNGLKAEWEHGDPNTPEAEQWDGWGTALKPAHEPIVLARKPFRGTVAANVLVHGTGAINVDGCRVAGVVPTTTQGQSSAQQNGEMYSGRDQRDQREFVPNSGGRWPANVILGHADDCVRIGTRQIKGDNRDPHGRRQSGFADVRSANGDGEPNARVYGDTDVESWECVDGCSVRMLDEQSGVLTSGANPTRRGVDGERTVLSAFARQEDASPKRGIDKGGASRFFYAPKTSTKERDAGLDHKNKHATVKPIALMRWLQRLVTPPGGLTVDPFAGSGSSGCSAVLEDFDFIGIELDADDEGMVETATARITYWESTKTGGD